MFAHKFLPLWDYAQAQYSLDVRLWMDVRCGWIYVNSKMCLAADCRGRIKGLAAGVCGICIPFRKKEVHAGKISDYMCRAQF